jgi:hypothetical protein
VLGQNGRHQRIQGEKLVKMEFDDEENLEGGRRNRKKVTTGTNLSVDTPRMNLGELPE